MTRWKSFYSNGTSYCVRLIADILANMKTASVILDIPTQSLDSPYTYVVPDDITGVTVGCAVLVEFGSRRAVGYVMSIQEDDLLPASNEGLQEKTSSSQSLPVRSVAFHDESEALPAIRKQERHPKLKPLLASLSKPYFDDFGARLIQFIAHEYIAPLGTCVHLLTPVGRAPKVVKRGDEWELKKPAKRRRKTSESHDIPSCAQIAQQAQSCEAFDLTEGQAQAICAIEAALESASGECIVVDGVTGSGKTEVYLRAIRSALARDCGAIVLVPEISLTPQTVSRFKGRFGDTVAVMHSRMSAAERYDQWEDVRCGRKRVVVGARSALFSPVENLGLIVIDEEHESTYKQESAPRYHARDVAAWMVKELGGVLVLGSATPSIETLCRTKVDSAWKRVSLLGRANGKALPEVKIVDMAQEFGTGSRSMFSRQLKDALFAAVDAGHKAVLMLNQRGFANFLLCRECGYVPECPTCSVSFTYHEQGNMLVCHHCGRRMVAPATCPACGSPYLRKFGSGTQRVESELLGLLSENGYSSYSLQGKDCKEDLPSHTNERSVAVIRMDSDTTSSRDAHERLLKAFAQAGAAILLGTQMIAKGLDFDEVVLVGVINADTQLRLPDFRAAERSFDLIEQVAGRAGRGNLEGQVLVQTYMADAVAIRAAAAYDRQRFLADELPKRRLLGYPPYTRLANLLIWGADAEEVREVALDMENRVNEVIRDVVGSEWVSLGAAPCAINRLRGQYRWHILIKAPRDADIAQLVEPVIRKRRSHKGVNVACDVDPLNLL